MEMKRVAQFLLFEIFFFFPMLARHITKYVCVPYNYTILELHIITKPII